MKAIKQIRLKHYDYSSNGFYFVTIVTDRRQKLLVDALRDVVARFIGRLSEESEVSIDKYIIMDDHVHMILVLDNSRLSLGEVIRRFKARTSKKAGIRLWQPNYYEHIIRTDEAREIVWQYIENNPLAEKLDLEEIYKGRPINRATTAV